MTGAVIAALTWYGLFSVATFAAFGRDKRAAGRGERRTPERTLHALELLGGWPGAFAAMGLLRHKNRKFLYVAVACCIALLHVGLWAMAAFRFYPPLTRP